MKFANWIDQWHQKNCKTYPNHDVIDQKSQTQNLNFLFILKYKTSQVFRQFEQLSSLIG